MYQIWRTQSPYIREGTCTIPWQFGVRMEQIQVGQAEWIMQSRGPCPGLWCFFNLLGGPQKLQNFGSMVITSPSACLQSFKLIEVQMRKLQPKQGAPIQNKECSHSNILRSLFDLLPKFQNSEYLVEVIFMYQRGFPQSSKTFVILNKEDMCRPNCYKLSPKCSPLRLCWINWTT